MDIPYSLGVVSPCVLDLSTSRASSTKPWYAALMERAYQQRSSEPVSLTIEKTPTQCECLLVNTLYPFYGDAVSLLLRINALRNQPVIVLVNRALVWLVPDWVAGIWVVERSITKESTWSDALTSAIKLHATEHELSLSIPTTFQHCQLSSEELQDFTRIKPFPRDLWTKKLSERPVVTFMWRSDRAWPELTRDGLLNSLMTRSLLARKIFRRLGVDSEELFVLGPKRKRQLHQLITLAEGLRRLFPKLEFVVCGLGRHGSLPSWITDRRVDQFSESTNQEWVKQGARSHILFGVLGSHTVLPGALAGAYIELVPRYLTTNVLTTVPVRATEVREAVYCYRLLPADVRVDTLQSVIAEILYDYPYKQLTLCDEYYKQIDKDQLNRVRAMLTSQRRVFESLPQMPGNRLFN